ncbi:hypothetical protein Taro_045924, partial [Colocasia esculenta]|nr:hypothetical protein [Colocasia esculenta]
ALHSCRQLLLNSGFQNHGCAGKLDLSTGNLLLSTGHLHLSTGKVDLVGLDLEEVDLVEFVLEEGVPEDFLLEESLLEDFLPEESLQFHQLVIKDPINSSNFIVERFLDSSMTVAL